VNIMHCNKVTYSAASGTRGFTLIEVLVALLTLSIGLLGLASLQATSLRFNNDSSAQTQAAYLASDIADRMRANASQLAAYPNLSTNPPGSATPSCYTGGCSPAQMADNDVYEWYAGVKALPGGKGVISDAGGGLYKITVMWDQDRSGAAGTNCNIDDPNDLRCVTVTTQP
jgi:type IV pilus assembly protein PilV